MRSATIALTMASETSSPASMTALALLTDLRAGINRGAQHVAGGELWNLVSFNEPLCLRPLPRPRGAKQYEPHRPLFPPRNFDFLISPSY